MHHTYINTDKAFNEVLSTFDSKGKIVIGFNFDTIHFNEFGSGEDYNKIIELLLDKKPIHISIYTEPITQIITKKKCLNCHRLAEYQNTKEETFCWIHTQNLN